MKKIFFVILTVLNLFSPIAGRSPFRKKDVNMPTIAIRWKNSRKAISHTNWAYKEYPIFTSFNKDHFYQHLLPTGTINDIQDPTQFYDCHELSALVEDLLRELRRSKREFTHFKVLKDKNFNYKQRCGLIILQFKNYPFVLKLFMETPTSFIDPYCKGFESQFFFYMSGGMNRHIAGLTRIKNLEIVNDEINNNPRWKNKITTPRKWYWLPKKQRWMQIEGYNIGGKKELSTLMPGIYAIIADTIDTNENAPLLSSQQRSELVMELAMNLHLFIDPHSDNFVLKQNETADDYHISIVDTEHFPSIVGLKEEPFFNNHLEWFLYLGAKYFQDAFLQSKNDRREAQYKSSPCALQW